MRYGLVGFCALVGMLSAGTSLEAEASSDETSEIVVIGQKPHIIPGLWEYYRGATFPYTPGVRTAFKALPGYKIKICIRNDDLNEVMQMLLGDGRSIDKNGQCKLAKVKIIDGKIVGGYNCRAGFGPRIEQKITGEISKDHMRALITSTAESAHGRTYFTSRATAKLIGKCEL